ncbi:MAG: VCBS repeat-containing protein [Acidobacteriales bacterium]|nr:VCBS repeat-containing protein [Terriglobales bacterium]
MLLALVIGSLILVSLGAAQRTPEPLRSIDRKELPTTGKVFSVDVRKRFVPGQLLVRFRQGLSTEKRGAALNDSEGKLHRQRVSGNLDLVELPPGADVAESARNYRQSPDVIYAEPNYVLQASQTPNDPLFNQQWGLSNNGAFRGKIGADISVTQAWDLTTGTQSVVVAVLDTGVDFNHPDLTANIYRNSLECTKDGIDNDGNGYSDDCQGVNVLSPTTNSMDDNGHGTHVAGIIAAAFNNGMGVAGVAPSIRVLPCKFLDRFGYGSVADAVKCLNYVKWMKAHGVNIIATSNSWGGVDYSQALADAINDQMLSGILFIAAAGNDFTDNDIFPIYPANSFFPNVISVAASTREDAFANFSNTGKYTVHVTAPGQEILSTLPGNSYGYESGTSMATPFVSGTAALLASQNPTRNWKQIKNLILAGNVPVNELTDTITGGRLNAARALTCSSASLTKQLRPIGKITTAAVGSPLTIAVLSTNCGSPAPIGDAIVSNGDRVGLLDNGIGRDQSAGDGVFTGSWTPLQYGSYTIQLPTQDTVEVEVLEPYWYQLTTPSYVSISGTSLDLGDDSVAKLISPFPVRFGKSQFTSLWVSSNGTVSFTNAVHEYFNRPLPLQINVNYYPGFDPSATTLLAVLWDDLFPIKGTAHNVFWDVVGTAPNRRLVIEWRDVGFYSCRDDLTSTVRFEVIFREDSNEVSYQYARASNECSGHRYGTSATAGLEVSPDIGTTVPTSGGISDDSAVSWQLASVPQPVNPIPSLVKFSPNWAPYDSPDTWVTVTGTNFVPGSFLRDDGGANLLLTQYVSNTELRALVPHWMMTINSAWRFMVVNPTPGGGTSGFMPFGIGVRPLWLGSIFPASALAGSPGFTLTLKGENLRSTNYVFFNNQMKSFTIVDDFTITATILASDISSPGKLDVTVFSGPTGSSNLLKFEVISANQTEARFAWNSSLGDGRNDIGLPGGRFLGRSIKQSIKGPAAKFFLSPPATTSASNSEPPPSNTATSGNGSNPVGPLLRPVAPTGYLPADIVSGDFNEDGKLDWAIANAGSSDVWVYLGRGDGTAALPKIIPLLGISPIAIKAARLDGDNHLDLIVAEADSRSVSVLHGRGDGTFEGPVIYHVPASPLCLAVADLNGDGYLDVIVGMDSDNQYGPFAFMPGDANGHLGRPVTTPNPFAYISVIAVAVADFDKDGRVDLVASVFSGGYEVDSGTWIYLNTGDGKFKPFRQLIWSYADFVQLSVDTGDVDGDGCPDAISQDSYTVVNTFLGDCAGDFVRSPTSAHGDTVWTTKLADVNGDGHLDAVGSSFVLAPGSGYGTNSGALLSVMLGDGQGKFSRARVFRGEGGSFGLAVADLNHDGKVDVITANQNNDSASIFLNDGQGGFGSPQGNYIGYVVGGGSGYINAPSTTLAVADMNGDGKKDFLLTSITFTGSDLIVVPQSSDGTFAAPLTSHVLPLNGQGNYVTARDFAVGDFRHTGRKDVAVMFGDNGWQLLLAANAGNGTFTPINVATGTEFLAKIAAGDFDKDGHLDLVIAGQGQLTFYKGNGGGAFSSVASFTYDVGFPGWPAKLAIGDFNSDGKLDVLIWQYYNQVPARNQSVYLLLGKGDGTFNPARKILDNSPAIEVADLNHDGLPDIVQFGLYVDPQAYDPAAIVSIYLCNSDGTFRLANRYPQFANLSSESVYTLAPGEANSPSAIADYDGDGNLDIAVFERVPGLYGRSGSSQVRILRGVGDGSFVVGASVIRLKAGNLPGMAADLDGDGKAEMIELDSYSSSFHVIPIGEISDLRLFLLAQPVIGNSDGVRVQFDTVSASDRQVTLTANPSTLLLPSSITVPAGVTNVDVPFTLSNSFDSTSAFAISATSATANAVVYGRRTVDPSVGFGVSWQGWSNPVAAGQSTFDYGVSVYSSGGFSGTVRVRCENLPSFAYCNWGGTEGQLYPGSAIPFPLKVQTNVLVPGGSYMFTVVAYNGSTESRANLQLNVVGINITITLSRPQRPGRGGSVLAAHNYTGSVSLTNLQGPFQFRCASENAACNVIITSVSNEAQRSTVAIELTLARRRTRSLRLQAPSSAPNSVLFTVMVKDFRKTIRVSLR